MARLVEPTKIGSLDDIVPVLDHLSGLRGAAPEGMNLYQTLVHCAQSLEYGIAGFPELKPRWFRASLGPLAASVFLYRGAMRHDLHAPIPKAPAIESEGDPAAAIIRLRNSIDRFRLAVRNGSPLPPHFAYGAVAPAEYGRLQALHIADHLKTIEF